MESKQRQWPLDRRAVIKLFGDYGIQPTQQRIDIAQILFDRPQHLSADQILKTVNESRPTVSKATVYNTLGLFADKGLVRQVIVDPSRVFYDSNTSEHHHLYNIDQGTLTDISVDQLTVSGTPELPAGMVTEGIDVIIRVRSE
jgi:Fur family iron response transcriptional regulator